jgi:hypothetical protein
MKVQLGAAEEILSRTPAVLSALLEGVSSDWAKANEGDDTWSAYDIVGHLIQGEHTDWITRARIILEHGESQPFEPFDRYAQFEKSKGESLEQLLEEFDLLRKANLKALKKMSIAGSLDLTGTHPELGRVTLGQLLATWVAHDLSHISQAARVMCRQYTDEVGPWKAYLPLLS